jgi:hypothetical protein
MKKLLSIALVLSLMLVSVCSFPASAATKDIAAAENWKVYGGSSTALNDEVGVAVSWGYVKQNTNSAYANGDTDSLKLNAKSQYAALPLTVEKNKDYVVSYKFYSDAATPATYTSGGVTYSYLLNKTGVIAPNHNVSPWNAANNFYNFISYNLSFISPDGLWSAKTNNSRRTTDWVETGKWHTVNLSFNSKNNETVMLSITPGVDSFYVDDVTLKEVSTFENLGNWGIYQASSSDTSYQVTTNYDGESCQTKMSWCNITNDTKEDADGSGKSIKINGNAFNVAANFPTLKANAEYTLSFKYKPSATSTVGSNSYYFTSHIIKRGAAFNQWNSGPAEYVATVPSGTGTTDWKEISTTFTTDDTTDYMLEFRFGFGAGYVCYLDDFVLTEILPPPVHPQADDWKIYATGTTYVNENAGTSSGNWATVTTNNDEKHINNGDDCSLKLHSKNQYATYKFPVEKNAKYTVSYNFISENTGSSGYIISRTGILAEDSSVVWAAEKGYYNFLANNVAYTAKNGVYADKVSYSQRTTNYAAANTWHHIDLEFESGNNEYMYLVVFSAVDDMYVDKITVTLNERNAVKVNTAYNNVAALRTSESSSTGKNGLRVYNNILKSYLDSNTVVEYGSIATRKELLGGDELTVNSANIVKGIAYNSTTQTTPILYAETDDANIFTSYLSNIPTNRYEEEYVVRAYVIDNEGKVYYGDTVSVCVFDVVYAIDCGNSADGTAPTDADIAAFEAFANFDGNYAAYDVWLTANSLPAGSLRNPAN